MRLAVLLAVFSVGIGSGANAKRPLPAGEMVEVEVKDVVTVSPHHANVVLLKVKGAGVFLPIWIGSSEALAISLRLARQSPPRPLTHDLIDRMLATLGAKVSKIHIEDVRESV